MYIKAYHGTDLVSASSIVSSEKYFISKNGNEWIGEGIYFFVRKNALENARKWAISQGKKVPTVLENDVLLGEDESKIIDFNLEEWQEIYSEFRESMLEKWESEGFNFETKALKLDFILINILCDLLQIKAIIQQRYVRVLEDSRLGSNVPNCSILCVRDENIIKEITIV